MHIVIGGYGRLGRLLAHEFEARGHTVAVVDRNPVAFEEFDEIRGRKIAGEVFDRETIELAGIRKAGCFCAATSGDNSNFIAARVAKERYGVGLVIARIYEPRRAVIYRDAGISTISSVDWAMGQFLSMVPDPSPEERVAAPAPPSVSAATAGTGAGVEAAAARRVVIVGGGKAGAYLAEHLRRCARVTLIEARADKSDLLRRQMPDIDVIHGDGCEPPILERAGAGSAEFVAAATGDDEDNLVVCHLVKAMGSTSTVVARINHPANEWLFTSDWGVDVPVGAAAGLYDAVSARTEDCPRQ
jgi:Trk K+ transport system NAD-binding subunit